MKTLLVLTLLAGIPAGESGLPAPNDTSVIPRRLAITDGGSLVTNVDLASGPRNPAQFNMLSTQNAPVPWTAQCPDAGAWIYPDTTIVAPGTGTMVPAGGAYSSACFKSLRVTQNDGGIYVGCVVSLAPLAGATSAECFFHKLNGTSP